MERTAWPDERLDDAFAQLREDMREFRAEVRQDIFQLKLLVLGSNATIVAALVALHG